MGKRLRVRAKSQIEPLGSIAEKLDDAMCEEDPIAVSESDAETEYECADTSGHEGPFLGSQPGNDQALLAKKSVVEPVAESLALGSDDCSDAEHGVALGSDDDDTVVIGARKWIPGYTCGQWVERGSPLLMQSQVLVANVALVCRRCSLEALRKLLGACKTKSTFPLFIRAAAMLLCLSCARVYRNFKALADTSWKPEEKELPRGDTLKENAKPTVVLKTLVRAALSESLAGGSDRAFVRHISRLALDGVDVGGKFHTEAFVREARYLATKVLSCQDRLDLDQKLPGLGIPSSFAVLFDGVPVGGISTFNRHGNVEVVCLAAISPLTGRINARFVTWAVSSVGHAGPDIANTILNALSELPLCLERTLLKRRMVAIGGDGAVVRGGPDRQKPGTRAADLMWLKVHPKSPRLPSDDDLLVDLVPPAERPRDDGRRRPRGELEDHWVNEPQAIHSVTEWDKFHREDIALTRAIAACPLAEELYAICALMDNLFGLGQGRLLLKAGAEATGARFRSGRLPGMTRKAVQLCTEPGHLLDNFKAYAVGLHIREAWRQAGHDQNTSKLIDAGRRLSSVQLVCFALAFRDIMSGVVAPWVAEIQKSSLEPWVVDHHWKAHEQRLCAVVEALSHFRDFLRILVLLKQWVPPATLREFTKAAFYSRPSSFFLMPSRQAFNPVWGRSIPSVVLRIGSMLHASQPKFQEVELICLQEAWQFKHSLVGPHCQCPFLRPRKRRGYVTFRGKRIRAPLWVSETRERLRAQPIEVAESNDFIAHNGTDALVAIIRPSPADIRWQWVQKEALKVPSGVPPEGRFRDIHNTHARHCSSCIIPPILPHTLLEIDSAFVAAIAFLRKLLQEERKLFGSEGMSTGMARLTRCISRCFDWGRLLRSSPTVEDINSFFEAYELLYQYLRYTEWPSQADFPDVVRGWPNAHTMKYQYTLLMRRIRGAAATKLAHGWWLPVGFRVVPVASYTSIVELLGPAVDRALEDIGSEHRPNRRMSACFLYRIASVVSSFVGHGVYSTDALVAKCTPQSFVVSHAKLARVGFPWHGKQSAGLQKRVTVEKWALRSTEPGGLATLLVKGSIGKLVYIEERVRELDWSAVSAAIDSNPYFTRDGPSFGKQRRSRVSTWHAVRVHHQCRLLGVPEACCERTGSIMKRLWQKNPSVSVSALMDLTALAAAGVSCCGTKRDEQLCQAVADSMTYMGRMPTLSKRTERRRAKDGITISRAVENFRLDAEAALREMGREDHLDTDMSSTSDEGLILDESEDEEVSNVPKRARAATMIAEGSRLSNLKENLSKHLVKGRPSMTLSVDMQNKLASAVTAKGVSALPLRHECGGSKDSRRASSVVKDRLLLWLDSDLGKEWKEARDRRVQEAYDG